MNRVWKVKRGERQSGPFSAAELVQMAASGRLLSTDFVRKDDMAEWQAAGTVKGLFASAVDSVPPPLVTPAASVQQTVEGDSTGGVIPYKNPKALIAYYTGLFLSPCCLVGLPLGIVPLVFGVLGLRDRKRNPAIKGSAHAWIGIVLGSISLILTVIVWVWMIAAFISAQR